VRVTPRLRGPLAVRLPLLVIGLFVFATGIVALLESGLGLSPWDVLHQGLAERTRLSFGEANIAVSILVLAIAWMLGARVGIGTLANAFLVGAFVQLLTGIESISALSDRGLGLRIALLAIGIALMGIGTAIYLGAGLGAGPRDSLMVVGAERTGLRIGVVRGALELAALAVGFALGGTVGFGTVAFALLIGPAVECAFWLLQRASLARPAVNSGSVVLS